MPAWELDIPPTAPGEISCIGLRVTVDAAWLEACRPLVAAEELREAQRYAHLKDAITFLTGRVLVRQALRATFGSDNVGPFARGLMGKPYCPTCEAHFSISHSQNMVWVAVCRDAPCGIDVEAKLPLSQLLEISSCLHPREQTAILSLSERAREQAFYRCWTRKEAVLKALGHGLYLPLHSFEVDISPNPFFWIVSLPTSVLSMPSAAASYALPAVPSMPNLWSSATIDVGSNYSCSVAAAAANLVIRELHIPGPLPTAHIPEHRNITTTPPTHI
ncbi:MAG: 4'-phosphopantetheinyl transferase superfamily protein [Desulfovibrio sp.]|nr:4'-phosphopantetheinyl transferase superfamily protein [Desulfovibrio sp.]